VPPNSNQAAPLYPTISPDDRSMIGCLPKRHALGSDEHLVEASVGRPQVVHPGGELHEGTVLEQLNETTPISFDRQPHLESFGEHPATLAPTRPLPSGSFGVNQLVD
jgi:hypothetical protein